MAFGLRITLKNEQIGARFKRSINRKGDLVRRAIRDTALDLAFDIEREVRADIRRAGKFGSRWTDGFVATPSEGGGRIRLRITMQVPYWTVFQEGKVIEGKPLLWIPLDFATDAKGIRARDYPGQLFRVDRAGKAPLLLAAGSPAQPKYFGKESVTIPKKFHIREIIARASKGMADVYRRNFKRLNK